VTALQTVTDQIGFHVQKLCKLFRSRQIQIIF
jgi:hypothetical protein